MDSAGNLYGTTELGGAYDNGIGGDGTIFELRKGSGTVTKLADFNGAGANGQPANGLAPVGGVIMDSHGNLFGTTRGFDVSFLNLGTVFELPYNNSTQTYGSIRTLHFFSGGSEGGYPRDGLVMDSNGNLYGVTNSGGIAYDPNGNQINNQGTVFEVPYDGTTQTYGALVTLHAFNGYDGGGPYGALIIDKAGNLYGTTQGGFFNYNQAGTVFKFDTGTGAFTTLASFRNRLSPSDPPPSGPYKPMGALVMDSSGNLYGTTSAGNFPGGADGTVFEVTAAGQLKTLAIFPPDGANGDEPQDRLILDSSGNLYGTVFAGGPNSAGTVFEVTPGTGTITNLATFTRNGGGPECGLVMDRSGNLFGTTISDDIQGGGTIFELSPSQVSTTTSLASDHPSGSTYGQSVTYTATVSPNSGTSTPTGSVQFQIDGSNFGSAITLTAGSASITANLPAGAHIIQAIYTPQSIFLASSASLTQTVNRDFTTATLAVTPAAPPSFITFPVPTPNSGPADMVAGADGNVWFSEPLVKQIARETPTGQITEFAVDMSEPSGSGIDIAPGTDGIWFAGSQHIGEVSFQGVLLHDYTIPSAVNNPNGGMQIMHSLGPDGNIWYTEPGGSAVLGRLTPSGEITEYPLPFPAIAPIVGPDGNFWLESTSSTAILRVTPSGVVDGTFNMLSGSAVRGLTAGPDGDLWMVQGARNVIVHANTAGQILQVFPVSTPNSGLSMTTWGSDGALWFEESAVNQVGRLTMDGKITEFQLSPGLIGGAIKEQPDGNIWVPLGGANQVGMVVLNHGLSVYGQPVTLAARVSSALPNGATPTGTVTFYNGSTVLGTVSLPAGGPDQVSLTTSALPLGTDSITAVYSGDSNFLSSGGRLTQTVSQDPTVTAVAVTPANPSILNQSVTFTATVSATAPGGGTPTGTVQFQIDGTNFGSPVMLTNGSASITTATLAVGPHTITANYSGDNIFLPSTGSLAQIVNPDATTTTGTASPNPSSFGQLLSISASVAANAPGAGMPTGSVDFYDVTIARDLGNVTLIGGKASVSTATLPVGSQTITLNYSGDGNFLPSVGNVSVTILESIYVLSPTASAALSLAGTSTINVPGVIKVDSNSPSAILAVGGVKISASAIQVVGGYLAQAVPILGSPTFSPTPTTGVASFADPLAGLAAPTGGTARASVDLNSGSLSINPGIYGHIRVSGNASLTMNPGIYVIAGGGFTVSFGGKVTGSGVMIYNAGSNYPAAGGSFGGIAFVGTGSVDLSAPTTGAYAGIVLFQARANTRAILLGGTETVALNGGIIYAPSALLAVGSLTGSTQLQHAPMIVSQLALLGTAASTLTNGAEGTNQTPGQLLAGDLEVYVDNRNGYFTADELARIQDTINGLDTMLAPFSVTITEVSDPGSANLVLDNGTTSASGGAADGVLGCFNGAAGEITILQGWNWYAGADSTLIGSSQYDFQSVVTHELGHALGLGHSPNTASPMYETLATGQVHRTMTVADLNIPDPPSGADPERAALSFWQQVYFGVEPSLAKGEVENWNNTPASSQQTALKTVLPDLTATADFADRAARMLVDGQNERLLQRVSLPITDDQADFWSSIGGTPGLDNVIGPTGDLAGQ